MNFLKKKKYKINLKGFLFEPNVRFYIKPGNDFDRSERIFREHFNNKLWQNEYRKYLSVFLKERLQEWKKKYLVEKTLPVRVKKDIGGYVETNNFAFKVYVDKNNVKEFIEKNYKYEIERDFKNNFVNEMYLYYKDKLYKGKEKEWDLQE